MYVFHLDTYLWALC